MKARHLSLSFALLAAVAAWIGSQVPAVAADAPALQAKEGWYPKLVNVDFVKKFVVVPPPEGVMIVDSRPTARKYDPGHIPTAVNIPDTQFEKMTDLLPKDKAATLIFYCDGVDCILSHKSAFKAEKLGYTNVQVYAEGYPDWIKQGNIGAVSVAYIKKLMDEKAAMTLVDSRPKERKYDKGHIPGAISIPDTQFEKMTDKLPADKAAPLFFYCDGLNCKLSGNSAEKAVKLGYTKVMVVPEGWPGWEKAYGAAAAGAPAIEQGKESGTITVASFEKIFKEAPDSIALIDVRDPNEFASGTFKGAVNIPINTLEKNLDKLPANKPIVFFCGAAGRGGEAHDMVKLLKPDMKTYFINANIKWNKDGSYTMTEIK